MRLEDGGEEGQKEKGKNEEWGDRWREEGERDAGRQSEKLLGPCPGDSWPQIDKSWKSSGASQTRPASNTQYLAISAQLCKVARFAQRRLAQCHSWTGKDIGSSYSCAGFTLLGKCLIFSWESGQQLIVMSPLKWIFTGWAGQPSHLSHRCHVRWSSLPFTFSGFLPLNLSLLFFSLPPSFSSRLLPFFPTRLLPHSPFLLSLLFLLLPPLSSLSVAL